MSKKKSIVSMAKAWKAKETRKKMKKISAKFKRLSKNIDNANRWMLK